MVGQTAVVGGARCAVLSTPGEAAQGQRSLELRERVVGNALYAWAEAVAMSAGAEVGFSRADMGPPTGDLFSRLRQARLCPHVHRSAGLRGPRAP